MFKKKDTAENMAFWNFVEKTAKNVEENFPVWKRGDNSMTFSFNGQTIEVKCDYCGEPVGSGDTIRIKQENGAQTAEGYHPECYRKWELV